MRVEGTAPCPPIHVVSSLQDLLSTKPNWGGGYPFSLSLQACNADKMALNLPVRLVVETGV